MPSHDFSHTRSDDHAAAENHNTSTQAGHDTDHPDIHLANDHYVPELVSKYNGINLLLCTCATYLFNFKNIVLSRLRSRVWSAAPVQSLYNSCTIIIELCYGSGRNTINNTIFRCQGWCKFFYQPPPQPVYYQPNCLLFSWMGLGSGMAMGMQPAQSWVVCSNKTTFVMAVVPSCIIACRIYLFIYLFFVCLLHIDYNILSTTATIII